MKPEAWKFLQESADEMGLDANWLYQIGSSVANGHPSDFEIDDFDSVQQFNQFTKFLSDFAKKFGAEELYQTPTVFKRWGRSE